MPPKKAQRTKGNVKPSSSSQAAQLLAASGQAPTGFIGFGTQPAFVPASEVLEDSDTNLDADFRLVLRKLTKKDTTTKIKALQEFSTLCQNKGDGCVSAVLPFWPRLYNKVSIDVDHKVRELSQKALGSLSSRVGKAIAPYLKNLMGHWMVAMCDTYPTVASAANSAFTATFPGAKQAGAIRFCKGEIIECLSTNILKHTAQTLSDPLTTSEEDMEAKYLRVVSSSLQATRKLINALPGESVNDHLGTQLSALLASPAFWKHASRQDEKVKGSLLSLLSSVIQQCPDISDKSLNKICPLVISSLDAVDPSLVSSAWEALLALVSAHTNCWEHVNWQKAAWPKIKRTLETGCNGQAAIIAPCLLPLLTRIPAEKLSLSNFFEAFRLGLNEDGVLNSPSVTSCLVRSFMECAQYCVTSTESCVASQVRRLTEDQVLVVVEASLSHPKPALARSELYALLCPFLAAAGIRDASIEDDFWSDLSEFVRNQLSSQFISQIEGKKESSLHMSKCGLEVTLDQLCSRLTSLVCGLVYRESVSGQKKERVRFGASETSSTLMNIHKKQKHSLSPGMEHLVSDILVVSYTLSHLPGDRSKQFYVIFKELTSVHIPTAAPERLSRKLEDKVAGTIVEDLGFSEVPSVSIEDLTPLLISLKSQLKLTEEYKRINPYLTFLCEDLVSSTLACGENTQNGSQDIVMVFFNFLSYVDEYKGENVLQTVVDNLCDPVTTCQFLEQLLKQANHIPACRQLLKGSILGKKIESFAQGLLMRERGLGQQFDDGAVWALLTSVVATMEEVDSPLFSSSCLEAVLSLCKSTLHQLQGEDTPPDIDTAVSVVTLVQALFDKHKLSPTLPLGALVTDLVAVLLNSHMENKDLEVLLKETWSSGLKLVLAERAHEEGRQLVESLCSYLTEWALTKLNSLDRLQHVSATCTVVLTSLVDCVDSEDLCVVTSTWDLLCLLEKASLQEHSQIMEYLYIKGDLMSLPPGPGSQPPPSTPLPLPEFSLLAMYNSRLLMAWRELQAKLSAHGGGDGKEPEITDTCLLAIAQLCENLLIIQTASELQRHNEVDIVYILHELKKEMAHSLQMLKPAQLSKMLDSVLNREEPPQSSLVLGLHTGLSLTLSQAKTQQNIHQWQEALLRLQTYFVLRSLPASPHRQEVLSLLSEVPLAGHLICQGFTVALNLLMNEVNFDLINLSDCISGFLRLASEHQLLTVEVKLSLFEQLHSTVSQLKDRDVNLLHPTDLEESSASLHYNRSVCGALRQLIVACNEPFWEFSLCTLVGWIQYFLDNPPGPTIGIQAVQVSVCHLASCVTHTFATAPVKAETTQEGGDEALTIYIDSDSITEKAKTEWDEFFSEGLYSPLLPLFVQKASLSPTQTPDPVWHCLMTPLSAAVSQCPLPQLLDHQLQARLTVSDTSALPDSMKTLLNNLCPLLTARHRAPQVASWALIKSVIPEVPKYEEVVTGAENEEEEEMRCPPEALVHVTELGSQFLDSLMVARVDEHIQMDTGTEEHTQALGYLLAWSLLLQLFRVASNQLRAKYAQYFKSHDSVHRLLDHLFRLMPLGPSPAMLDFPATLDASASESREEELPQLALMLYTQCLETLPALVRQWWGDQDRKSANFVDKFTSQYLSTGLIYQQITASQNSESDMEGITIKARPAAREVCATYAMAEVTVNMTITLPENFPLGKLDVACDKRVGVSQAQWDRWLLQLNIFLQHQNGSIVEGLRLWKGNIDKKFEGIEDCMICFSVIHGTTFQLPRLTCKTCRKKFHSACLYKWFNTSQKSSCPLCRNLF